MFEALFGLLTFGTWLFWVMLIVFSILVMACVENEKGGFLFLATIIMFSLFCDDFLTLISSITIAKAVALAGVYLAIGTAWTLLKWYIQVNRTRRRIREVTAQASAPHSSVSSTEVYEFKKLLSPSANKARLTAWLMYWPWSMTWWAIRYPVETSYELLASAFEKIAASAKGDLTALEEKVRK